jgi:hypothetical protein
MYSFCPFARQIPGQAGFPGKPAPAAEGVVVLNIPSTAGPMAKGLCSWRRIGLIEHDGQGISQGDGLVA